MDCYRCGKPYENKGKLLMLDGTCDACRGYTADEYMRAQQTKPHMAELLALAHGVHVRDARVDAFCIHCNPLTDRERHVLEITDKEGR